MRGCGWPETSVVWPMAQRVPPARSLTLFPSLHRMVEYSLDLQNINLSAIRTVRVLRPLKAINRVPSELAPHPHPPPTPQAPEKTDEHFPVPGLWWVHGLPGTGQTWALLPWSSWVGIWA